MTELLSNPATIRLALIAAACLLPPSAWLLHRVRPGMVPRRLAIALAVAGPLALGAWFLQALLIETFGFDSLLTVALLFMTTVVIGAVLGWWVGRENAPRPGQ